MVKPRHCERSEAIQENMGALRPLDCFVTAFLAMTITVRRNGVAFRE
jgi:hypothetical protein